MSLLEKLERRVKEVWQKMQQTKNASELDRLNTQYKEAYQQYRTHRQWLAALEG